MRRILLLLALLPVFAHAGSVFREEGSIYLEDYLKKPVKLTVQNEAPIYFDAGLQRYLGALNKGQSVELLAVMEKVYRIRGIARQGQVAGWIEIKHLSALDDKFLATLRKHAERTVQVRELIKKNEVAINMTPDEVTQSLGKPQKKNSRVDATGRHDAWEYVHYELVPKETTGLDAFGRLATTVVYVKVPNGRLTLTFEDGLVNAIEQSEGNLARGGTVRMVVPPITVTP